MSKTFKSPTYAGREIHVSDRPGKGAFVEVIHSNKEAGTTVASSDAPAFCVAILEAAGCVDRGDTLLGDALRSLKGYLHNIEQEAKEAADRKVLEREAWELWTEFDMALYGEVRANSLSNLTTIARDAALVLARKAREMHKAKS